VGHNRKACGHKDEETVESVLAEADEVGLGGVVEGGISEVDGWALLEPQFCWTLLRVLERVLPLEIGEEFTVLAGLVGLVRQDDVRESGGWRVNW
jgi:hypothetical protein